MRVAYFSNQFADREGHGLARFARELFKAMRQLESCLEVIPIAAWSSMDKAALADLQATTGLKLLPWSRKLTPIAWTFLNSPKIEHWVGDSIDLVHAVALGYPIATKKPYVVSIHDLGPLTHPEFFTPKGTWIMKRSLDQAVRKADALICVSRSTANELTSYVGVDIADRVHVVHEGISTEFFEPVSECDLEIIRKLKHQGVPFILSTGKISPRKNTRRIIRALGKLADAIPHHLVLVGGEGWSTGPVQDELRNSPIADRLHPIGYVSDDELRALYAAAGAYVHTSLYEGFGLPILEAMASGCPVITSNISSLPEVAGDAAILVDPNSVDAIAEGIRAVCTDPELAMDLVERGRQRLRQFTWQACAEGVYDVYQSVV